MPAWTADLYFYEEGCISNDDEPSGVIPYDEVYQDESKEGVFSDYAEFPCWSVGRLIEIYLLWAELKKPQMIFIKEDVLMMDRMINELCYMAESERLDFSKLEL